MKVTIEVGASSATLMLALRELKRQQAAMEERYPEMQLRGDITGKEAERRLFAQGVAVQAVGHLAAAVADEERACETFGPRGDD